jgi:hypothetical protein
MRDFAGVRDKEDTKEARADGDEPVDDRARVPLDIRMPDLPAVTAGHTLRMQSVVHGARSHRRLGRPDEHLLRRRRGLFLCDRRGRLRRVLDKNLLRERRCL